MYVTPADKVFVVCLAPVVPVVLSPTLAWNALVPVRTVVDCNSALPPPSGRQLPGGADSSKPWLRSSFMAATPMVDVRSVRLLALSVEPTPE